MAVPPPDDVMAASDSHSWYLGVVAPVDPVADPTRFQEWAAILSRALSDAHPAADQVYLWKWGRGVDARRRAFHQGLLPAFLLAHEKLPASCSEQSPSQFEAFARHQLQKLQLPIPVMNPDVIADGSGSSLVADFPRAASSSSLQLAWLFPQEQLMAVALFRAMRDAEWPLPAQDHPLAYTELFLATPVAIRHWVGAMGVQPSWQGPLQPAAEFRSHR